MKIVVFTGDPSSAIFLYRLWWPFEFLKLSEPRQWDVLLTPQVDERILQGWNPARPDDDWVPPSVVVISRQVTAQLLPKLLRAKTQFGVRYVYDVDDNLFEVPAWNPKYPFFAGPGVRANIETFMRHADALFVSTPGLKDVYAELNDRIYVLPNSVDPELIHQRPRYSRGHVVGWVGSYYHDLDFDIAEAALRHLAVHGCDDPGDTRVRIFYRRKYPDIPNLDRVDGVNWEAYFQTLALCDLDIGLVPLVDHPFNSKGKSSNRWVEQSVVGTLTVASPVGEFARNIEHGRTGILIGEDENWADVSRTLLRDRAFRDRIVGAAREEVVEKWNVRRNCGLWGDALREVAARAPRIVSGRYVLGT